MVKQYKKLKFGIECSKGLIDPMLVGMRYDISRWQSSDDFSTISQLKIAYKDWMPITVGTCEDDLCYVNINVTNVYGGAKSYYVNPASATWTFNHNLGFNPNVTTTDEYGQEIVGIITYTSTNALYITFSSPVSGWAYLS